MTNNTAYTIAKNWQLLASLLSVPYTEPEIGSQGVVSEILNGKRQLNKRQIQELAKRFHVSPDVFF